MIKNKVSPRRVPDRDDYYMGLAFWIASKSKDPNTQVGAIIVDSNNEPLGTGYNGPPSSIEDDEINWGREPAEDFPFTKYIFMKHAESNAISHSKVNNKKEFEGATIYVTAPPCKSCMLDIVEKKISRVVYFLPRTIDPSSMINDEAWLEAKEVATQGGVLLVEFDGDLNWMRDRITWMQSMGVFDKD